MYSVPTAYTGNYELKRRIGWKTKERKSRTLVVIDTTRGELRLAQTGFILLEDPPHYPPSARNQPCNSRTTVHLPEPS